MPVEVFLLDTGPPPKYQLIAPRAVHLQQLGLSNAAIARRLGTTGKTVAKAIRWQTSEAPTTERNEPFA